jgi:hypothetical protein
VSKPDLNTMHLICAYLNEGCRQCPAVTSSPYGGGEKGCYGIAREIVNIVHRGGPFDSMSANLRWRARIAGLMQREETR